LSSQQTIRTALIPGATGMVGRRLAEIVHSTPGWQAIGLARRPTKDAPFPIRAVDLMNAECCRNALGDLSGVTDIFYAARYDHTVSTREPVEENLSMLKSVMDAIEPAASGLQHVHLVHGTKYYGSHLGPFRTPAKEHHPRHEGPNWYHAQEDFIVERQRGRSWTWSTSRPHGICDIAPGVARSNARVVAVYAAICKAAGLPFHFPGTAASGNALYQCTDATLLARAILFMATHPQCANQSYNVINGDFFRWINLWPGFADYFGMKAAAPAGMKLPQFMADKGPVWNALVKAHGLAPNPLDKVTVWSYGDFIFGAEHDIMSDTIKLRRAGFHDAVDSAAMFIKLFDALRTERIVP
jgi:nucleoside-diphosphate-sugar epimerase